jgi:hypothetical protein
MWKFTVLLMAVVSITPLIFLAVIDYHFTNKAVKSDILLRTSRLVSNTRRTISFFLAERKSALDFIVMNNEFDTLNNPEQLEIMETMLGLISLWERTIVTRSGLNWSWNEVFT